MAKLRNGVTLIEVVIAIVLLSVGALALEGSSALLIRRLAESKRASSASALARSRSESSFARGCGAVSSGSEEKFGVQSQWTIGSDGASVDIEQRLTYPTQRGQHAEKFHTGALCD